MLKRDAAAMKANFYFSLRIFLIFTVFIALSSPMLKLKALNTAKFEKSQKRDQFE